MITSIVNSLGQATSAVFTWFGNLVSSTGTLSLIITAILICLVFRFLIRPLVGQAMSDGVKSLRKEDLRPDQSSGASYSGPKAYGGQNPKDG